MLSLFPGKICWKGAAAARCYEVVGTEVQAPAGCLESLSVHAAWGWKAGAQQEGGE